MLKIIKRSLLLALFLALPLSAAEHTFQKPFLCSLVTNKLKVSVRMHDKETCVVLIPEGLGQSVSVTEENGRIAITQTSESVVACSENIAVTLPSSCVLDCTLSGSAHILCDASGSIKATIAMHNGGKLTADGTSFTLLILVMEGSGQAIFKNNCSFLRGSSLDANGACDVILDNSSALPGRLSTGGGTRVRHKGQSPMMSAGKRETKTLAPLSINELKIENLSNKRTPTRSFAIKKTPQTYQQVRSYLLSKKLYDSKRVIINTIFSCKCNEEETTKLWCYYLYHQFCYGFFRNAEIYYQSNYPTLLSSFITGLKFGVSFGAFSALFFGFSKDIVTSRTGLIERRKVVMTSNFSKDRAGAAFTLTAIPTFLLFLYFELTSKVSIKGFIKVERNLRDLLNVYREKIPRLVQTKIQNFLKELDSNFSQNRKTLSAIDKKMYQKKFCIFAKELKQAAVN